MNKSRLLNVFATLLYAFTQWMQIILITNLLGSTSLGLYTLIIAISGPIVMLSQYSLKLLIPTEDKYQIDLTAYNKFRNMSNIFYILISVFIIIFLDFSVYEKICFLTFTLFKYLENKEDFIYIENILNNKLDSIAWSRIIKSVFSIIFFSIFIFVFENLLCGIIALVITQAIKHLMYDRKYSNFKVTKITYSKREFNNILKLGLSLTLVGIFTSLQTNIPRYFMDYFHGKSTLGIYATLLYTIVIVNNIVITLNTTMIIDLKTKLSNHFDGFIKSFWRLILYYSILSLIISIFLVQLAPVVFTYIYGIDFTELNVEFYILSIYILLTFITKFFEMVINIFNKYNEQLKVHIIIFGITLVSSAYLIPSGGLVAALWVNVITFLILLLLQAIIIFTHIKKGGYYE